MRVVCIETGDVGPYRIRVIVDYPAMGLLYCSCGRGIGLWLLLLMCEDVCDEIGGLWVPMTFGGLFIVSRWVCLALLRGARTRDGMLLLLLLLLIV